MTAFGHSRGTMNICLIVSISFVKSVFFILCEFSLCQCRYLFLLPMQISMISSNAVLTIARRLSELPTTGKSLRTCLRSSCTSQSCTQLLVGPHSLSRRVFLLCAVKAGVCSMKLSVQRSPMTSSVHTGLLPRSKALREASPQACRVILPQIPLTAKKRRGMRLLISSC